MVDYNSAFWQTVEEVSGVNAHVEFAEKLIDKYKWSDGERRQLQEQLAAIRDKQRDDCLNLSVIGEFASGKSSFINALLQQELLVSSALQGTTVVNTVIEYSPKLYMRISFKDGTENLSQPGTLSLLRQSVSAVTTDSTIARKIWLVTVGLPSELLKQKIRIIDTPGTNSIESWHEEVTLHALNRLSDLSIILTDAVHPMPQTLMDFVGEHLADIYTQCAVAVTRYDLLRPQERDGMLDYVRRKLKSDLGAPQMLVLPFVAPAIIGEVTGQQLVDNQQMMARLSNLSAKEFMRHMAQRRRRAQIKKLLALTNTVLSLLDSGVSAQMQQCQKELRLLQKSRQADLQTFIYQQKQQTRAAFTASQLDVRQQLAYACDLCIETGKQRIKKGISDVPGSTIDPLKAHMENCFISQCRTEAEAVAQVIGDSQEKINTLFRKAISNFQKQFDKEFAKQGLLKVNFDINSVTPQPVKVQVANIQGVIDYVKKELSSENWAFGGGALVGAGVGTAILPGVGTVLGGFFGFLLGGWHAPDDKKVRENIINKVEAPLRSMFATVRADTLSAYDAFSDSVEKALEAEIDRYLVTYHTVIDKRIKDNNQRQKQLQNRLDKTLQDKRLIEAHQRQLTATMQQV